MTLYKILCSVLFLSMTLSACNKPADTAEEATEKLTSREKWFIDEINANDAPVFKNGKLIQQFGGISFERYMTHVRFDRNGSFSGYFIGDTTPTLLKWKTNAHNITVFSADTTVKGGEWTIDPSDVTDKSFSMKTQSTAYNYPQMTKVELKFKQ